MTTGRSDVQTWVRPVSVASRPALDAKNRMPDPLMKTVATPSRIRKTITAVRVPALILFPSFSRRRIQAQTSAPPRNAYVEVAE